MLYFIICGHLVGTCGFGTILCNVCWTTETNDVITLLFAVPCWLFVTRWMVGGEKGEDWWLSGFLFKWPCRLVNPELGKRTSG